MIFSPADNADGYTQIFTDFISVNLRVAICANLREKSIFAQ
jgi:hypothetical protein